jgi:CRISPR/Cas system CMR-associated protein Cmr1 (group 7 of RAMP superfamily)
MEMTSVYIVYATDDWGARKGIVGIYTNKAIAIDHIIDYYRENTDLTESKLQEARQQLYDFYQTQGITKADNFDIDIKSLNEWDW